MKRYAPHLAFVAAFMVSACDTHPVGPPDEATNQPYYWHQGERIYLQPEYGRIVVAYDEDNVPGAPALVTSVLDAFDLTVRTNETVAQVDDHHLLYLDGAHTNGPAAVAALRGEPGIAFVAPAYSLVEGGDTLLLVNELVVRFRDGVTQAAIDDLVDSMETRIVRHPRTSYGIDEYRIAYPAGADPLVFAIVMHENPLVQWVDPNKIGTSYPALAAPSNG